ncbi:MAG: DUF84 family protein [Anaerolineae bacterium]|nr:DUF84 family protein [Anaerolineae bacterium]
MIHLEFIAAQRGHVRHWIRGWVLRAGMELGLAVDAVTGGHDTKHHGGAIGAFTGGYLSRQVAYEHLLTLALARFLSADYYESAVKKRGAS